MDEIKRELSEEIRNLESALREEVEQRQRLEGMLDDQQQLHQAKMEDLKSQVEMQEEQAVYQIRDNSKTMGESLKMLEMRVLKLEEKRLEEYPQFGEGFSPGGDSRALLMKLLTGIVTNALLIFITGFLFLSLMLHPEAPGKTIMRPLGEVCLCFFTLLHKKN